MKFSKELLAELNEAVDLVDLAARYGVEIGPNGAGLCPFHGEKTPSFRIRGVGVPGFRCFGCGWSGDAIQFVQEIARVTFAEAVAVLARACGRVVAMDEKPNPEAEALRNRREQTRKVLHAAQHYYACALRADKGEAFEARKYLTTVRAIPLPPPEEDGFGWGYAPQKGHGFLSWMHERGFGLPDLREAGLLSKTKEQALFRGRIMLPVRDERGRVVSFVGRLARRETPTGVPKILNGPTTQIYQKSQLVYGIDLAARAMRQAARAIVVEGAIDRVQMHRAGWPETVATLGGTISRPQLERVRRYTHQLIFIADGDSAGSRLAEQALGDVLELGLSARCVALPPGHDPDDLLREAG